MAGGIQTKFGKNKLYNEKVVKVEHMKRSISSSGGKKIPLVPHQGVRYELINICRAFVAPHHFVYFRITTESGEQHLVHKGPGFGESSQTVVTSAQHMSDKWKVKLLVVCKKK